MQTQQVHHQWHLSPVSFAQFTSPILLLKLLVSNQSLLFTLSAQMLKENECIGRLRLWQVFFANPYEWWDNRQSKTWANYPDFKHKDTREKIWLRPDDPPWVRKQLELYDLEVAENGHRCKSRLSKKQNWKTQDFDYFDDEEVQYSAEAWIGRMALSAKNEEIHQAIWVVWGWGRLFLCSVILLNSIDVCLVWCGYVLSLLTIGMARLCVVCNFIYAYFEMQVWGNLDILARPYQLTCLEVC